MDRNGSTPGPEVSSTTCAAPAASAATLETSAISEVKGVETNEETSKNDAARHEDSSDTDSDPGSPCRLPQPVWSTAAYTKKECSNSDVVPSGKTVPSSVNISDPAPEPQVNSDNKASSSVAPVVASSQDEPMTAPPRVAKVPEEDKEYEEKQAAALQIMREARRQSQWSSIAAEEQANRERQEDERRRREVERAREAERRREEEIRRAEEEKQSLIEARRREDKLKRKVSSTLFLVH